jgi:hypothetical protein
MRGAYRFQSFSAFQQSRVLDHALRNVATHLRIAAWFNSGDMK